MFENILIPFEDYDYEYRTMVAVRDSSSEGFIKYKIEVFNSISSLERIEKIKEVLKNIPGVNITVIKAPQQNPYYHIIYFEFPDNLFPLFYRYCQGCRKVRIVFPYAISDIENHRIDHDIWWRCANCYITCSNCGETIPHYYQRSLPIHTLDHEPYCENCIPHCSSCGCVLGDGRGCSQYYEFNGDLYCVGCARPCSYCYVPYLVDELCPTCGCCPSCCRCGQEDECEYEIMSYSYKPTPIFHKLNENPLYLGVELEIEANASHNQSDIVKAVRDKLGLGCDICYFKHDASLGNEGVEIVFHPATLRYFTKAIKITNVLEELKKIAVSYNTRRCGIHVHIPKSTLTLTEKRKLICFTFKCRKYLIKFSKRNSRQIERWCKFYDSDAYKLDENSWKDSRYRVVNFCPLDTIEFRLFRGTLYSPRFLAFLRFVVAVVDYVKNIGISYIALNNSDQVWYSFVKFVKNKYHHLYQFLKKEGLVIQAKTC